MDIFKTARPWVSHSGDVFDDGRPIAVDGDGWPISLLPAEPVAPNSLGDQEAAALLIFNTPEGVYPTGEYICLYDGDGTIEFDKNASIVSQGPGRIVVQIDEDSSSFVRLKITATDPADYVRNIRLIMPGHEGTYDTAPFNPAFLATIAPFKVLRFMDWGVTNESEVATWDERTTLATYTQGIRDKGAALESMVDLANANLSDAWICFPHLATDDYVRKAATLVRDRLDPRLRVHFEYSNEVWNGLFKAARHAQAQGHTMNWTYISNGNTIPVDNTRAKLWWYSMRANEVLTICSEVFSEVPNRLVRVIAGQSTHPWGGRQIMDWNSASEQPDGSATTKDRFDVYAVAPYFGGYLGRVPHSDTTVDMTEEEVLAACDADSVKNNGDGLEGYTQVNVANATERGIPLVAYEGGQHLVGVGTPQESQLLTNLLNATNRAAGMQPIYAADLGRWKENNGKLFVAFSHASKYGKYGSCGALESQAQNRGTVAKWLGLMDYIATF